MTGPGSARPRISVALATYRGAPFVREQLQSVLDQSSPVDEIVVADDASPDDTLSIVLETLAGASVDVAVLEGEGTPLGVTGNFARALTAATGDLVLLCDQDDRWHPEKVATIAAHIADAGASVALVASDARLVDGDGAPLDGTLWRSLPVRREERDEIAAGRAFGTLLRRNLVTGATAAATADLVRIAAPFPPEWVHDEWLAIIAAAVGRVLLIDETLIDYRQHGANEIGVAAPTLRHRIRRVLEPGGARNAALAARAAVLVDRLEAIGDLVPAEALASARGKLAHERRRAGLSRHRLLRVPTVLRLLASGGYRRYSSQRAVDAVRDLLQPR